MLFNVNVNYKKLEVWWVVHTIVLLLSTTYSAPTGFSAPTNTKAGLFLW